MRSRRLAAVAGLLLVGAGWSLVLAFEDHVFVVTSDVPQSTGNCAAFDIQAPWQSSTSLEVTGVDTVVRHFFGLHYVVRPQSGDIQVIDPATFDTVLTFSVEATSFPQDILVVSSGSAYVSRWTSPLLYEVDPRSGELLDTVDLGIFADPDGIPEMSMMALDGHHLFVQIQRLYAGGPVAPSFLAVLDVRTNQLVDCDPVSPGVQGIPLTGLLPKYKMQIDGRRLYVSEPGLHSDSAGGIDEIDLDSLRAIGFITTEQQIPLDVGGFVLTSPVKGFVLVHTDAVQSSHLHAFSRIDGSPLGEQLWATLYTVNSIAHDSRTGQVYFLDAASGGVQVFDASTDQRLTKSQIDTGWAPVDLVVARAITPGEATDLRVLSIDPDSGDLTISYSPACGAADHTLVSGSLDDVASYAYADQVCGIGNSGEFHGFDPGRGSRFFLVVANDGAGTEGSYGTDSTPAERPEDLGDPVCTLIQDLALRCDRGP